MVWQTARKGKDVHLSSPGPPYTVLEAYIAEVTPTKYSRLGICAGAYWNVAQGVQCIEVAMLHDAEQVRRLKYDVESYSFRDIHVGVWCWSCRSETIDLGQARS